MLIFYSIFRFLDSIRVVSHMSQLKIFLKRKLSTLISLYNKGLLLK